MKSRILYVWIIAMLLVSTVAFGDIYTIGPGAHSIAESIAAGTENYDPQHTSGWVYKYTDESGYFYWYYEDSVDAEARVLLFEDESASAVAAAEAKVSGAISDYMFVSGSVSGTGEYDGQWLEDDPDPDGNSDGNGGPLDPYEGIAGDTQALTVASIEEGSDCMAYAYAEAEVTVNLVD